MLVSPKPGVWELRSQVDNSVCEYHLPKDREWLVKDLKKLKVDKFHIHHTLQFDESIWSLPEELNVGYDVTLHDYYFICPRVNLIDETGLNEIQQILDIYRKLNYQVLLVSNITGEGINELKEVLVGKNNIFVGQSGVGKSTLVNTVLPDAEILTKEVSENSGLGQHTTTVSRLHHLPSGGNLIDSPGIREFGLWHLDVERVTWCFKEFREFIGGCRFRDCKHLNDPGCIIQQAVADGDISKLRFESYHRILETMADGRAGARAPRV